MSDTKPERETWPRGDGDVNEHEELQKAVLENRRLRALVAIADAMFAEHAAAEQERSDKTYRAEFGHNGPRVASPLGSAGRSYVFERHRLSRKYPDLPPAAQALGQRGLEQGRL